MVSSLQATGCNTKCTHGCVQLRVCVCVCVMNPNVGIFVCANDGGKGRRLFQKVVVFVRRLCMFVSVCLRVLYLHTHTDTQQTTHHTHTHILQHTHNTRTHTHTVPMKFPQACIHFLNAKASTCLRLYLHTHTQQRVLLHDVMIHVSSIYTHHVSSIYRHKTWS